MTTAAPKSPTLLAPGAALALSLLTGCPEGPVLDTEGPGSTSTGPATTDATTEAPTSTETPDPTTTGAPPAEDTSTSTGAPDESSSGSSTGAPDGSSTGTGAPDDTSTSAPDESSSGSSTGTTDDSSTGTSTGTTGGLLCEPGAALECAYSGPPETLGVGGCKAGVKLCADDGMSYGPCTGEVTPAPEQCLTPDLDENCNGAALGGSATEWTRAFGTPLFDLSETVAIDSAGAVVLGASVQGDVDLGCGVLPGQGELDAVLAKFSGAGELLWKRHVAAPGHQRISGVAVDSQDNIVVAGYCIDDADWGGGPLSGGGEQDLLLAKYDADGQHLWSRCFTNEGDWGIVRVEVGPDDAIVVVWKIEGEVDFGGGTIVVPSMETALVKFDPTGQHLWSHGTLLHELGGTLGIDIDSQGNIALVGDAPKGIDFGEGMLPAGSVIVTLDPAGEHLWSRSYPSPTGSLSLLDVAFDPADRPVTVGEFSGTVSFEGEPLPKYNNGFITSSLLIQHDADGAALGYTIHGKLGDTGLSAIDIDDAGTIAVLGSIDSAAEIGGVAVYGDDNGHHDGLVAWLDPEGALQAHRLITDTGSIFPLALALDPSGAVVLSGMFKGAIDFGAGPIVSQAEEDVIVARLVP